MVLVRLLLCLCSLRVAAQTDSSPSASPTPCPYVPLLGRCTVSLFAFPTKLCNVDASGNLNPNDCLSECGPGWYCPHVRNCGPNGSSPEGNPWNLRPEYCPPSIACATQRLGSAFCAAAQGQFEPLLCPPGNYCPDQHTIVPCPAGTYCMRGSVAPTDCPSLSWCPEGTAMRRIFGGVVACLVLDAALVALFFFWRDYYEPGLWSRRQKWVRQTFGAAQAGVELEELGAPQMRIKDGMRSAFGSFFAPPGDAGGASLSASLLQDFGDGAGDGAFASIKAAAKIRLFKSFQACNKDFKMKLHFHSLKVEVEVREEGGATSLSSLFVRPIKKKVLLENASGIMLPEKVTAIMGPSGAGKTTLLNCIFGRMPRKNGNLFINEQPREMNYYKKVRRPPPPTLPSPLTLSTKPKTPAHL